MCYNATSSMECKSILCYYDLSVDGQINIITQQKTDSEQQIRIARS